MVDFLWRIVLYVFPLQRLHLCKVQNVSVPPLPLGGDGDRERGVFGDRDPDRGEPGDGDLDSCPSCRSRLFLFDFVREDTSFKVFRW